MREKMKNNLTSILFLIAINISTSIHSQSKSPDTHTKKRLASHKKTENNYIEQASKIELDIINKNKKARQDRANEKNINLNEYLSSNHESITELQKKLNKCNTDLSCSKDTWHSLNDFIDEYAEINAQYNNDTNALYLEYTRKIEKAQIKRDNAENQARIKGVNNEIAEIRDSLINQNDNLECLTQIEELFANFKTKRLESLDKFLESENQSRKKYLQTKRDINKESSQAISNSWSRRNQEQQEITLSHKQSL